MSFCPEKQSSRETSASYGHKQVYENDIYFRLTMSFSSIPPHCFLSSAMGPSSVASLIMTCRNNAHRYSEILRDPMYWKIWTEIRFRHKDVDTIYRVLTRATEAGREDVVRIVLKSWCLERGERDTRDMRYCVQSDLSSDSDTDPHSDHDLVEKINKVFITAAEYGRVNIVQFLLDEAIVWSGIEKKSFMAAVRHNHFSVVEMLLLKKDFSCNMGPAEFYRIILEASEYGSGKSLCILLQPRVLREFSVPYYLRDVMRSAMWSAKKRGDTSVTRILYDRLKRIT